MSGGELEKWVISMYFMRLTGKATERAVESMATMRFQQHKAVKHRPEEYEDLVVILLGFRTQQPWEGLRNDIRRVLRYGKEEGMGGQPQAIISTPAAHSV